MEFHAPLAAQGLVWVAEEAHRLIGFAACEAFAAELHLWELAVRHEAQGRGAGRALVAAAIDEARRRKLPAVSLTTFRDIPWNAPFYARLGFVEASQPGLSPILAWALAHQASVGLDVANRCAMRLSI